MKKIYLIGVIIFMLITGGCKKEEVTSRTHMPSIEGKVIEIREKNEILIEITVEVENFKKGDKVLLGYSKYYWPDWYAIDGYEHKVTPRLNDTVATSYWEEEIEEKDGYDYIPGRSILKPQIELQGRVIEVREDNELLIEVIKRNEQYNRGDKVLVGYQRYFYMADSRETETDDYRRDIEPRYNDKIKLGYFLENIDEKNGYTYMSNRNIEKYLDDSENQ